MKGDILEYRIVTHTYEGRLQEAVNLLVHDGWEPQGGISKVDNVSHSGTGYESVSQAMVRRAEI